MYQSTCHGVKDVSSGLALFRRSGYIDGGGPRKQESLDIVREFARDPISKHRAAYYGAEDVRIV